MTQTQTSSAAPTGAAPSVSQQPRRRRPRRRGWVALLPIVFLAALMGIIGLLAGDFYKVPMTIIFLITCIFSLLTLRGYRVDERIATFSRGAGEEQLLLMVWIFVMAGAFARSAQDMGAVQATVDMTMNICPPQAILGGLFLATCVVSLCIGTSVGTIVALVPVATGLATQTGLDTALVVAVVVGGSFFGDNLSFISDTTVAATRTQGCRMSDKFRTNIGIVWPAAVICLILYILIGLQSDAATTAAAARQTNPNLWLTLPYLVVLGSALAGMNVLIVLGLGCVLTGIVGGATGAYDFVGWLASMAKGIGDMGELILISMMAGGLLAVVRKGGGVTWIVRGITRRVRSRRGAEWCIAALVSLTNCFTANNTVAILSVGSITKDISRRYGVSARRAASLLDIFSCVVQGLLPYGAQLLMAAGLAVLSPLQIIPYLYYPVLVAVASAISITCHKQKAA